MGKIIVLLAFLSIVLCACNSNSPMQTDLTQSDIISMPLPSETSVSVPSETNAPVPAVLTEQDIYDFELLRSDWSKEQMEELGLEKEVNVPAGETYYSNDFIRYTYFDYVEEVTPAVVHVYGEYPGPRGISVGNHFDDVLALFPQDEDWRSNA